MSCVKRACSVGHPVVSLQRHLPTIYRLWSSWLWSALCHCLSPMKPSWSLSGVSEHTTIPSGRCTSVPAVANLTQTGLSDLHSRLISWNSMVIMHSRSNELCEESMQCRTSCGSTEVVLAIDVRSCLDGKAFKKGAAKRFCGLRWTCPAFLVCLMVSSDVIFKNYCMLYMDHDHNGGC